MPNTDSARSNFAPDSPATTQIPWLAVAPRLCPVSPTRFERLPCGHSSAHYFQFAAKRPPVRPHAKPAPRSWWTGEDSNLRSPQGAADLQSAGFSHSPTRPANSSGTQTSRPANLPGQRTHALRTPPPAHTALPPAGRSEGTQVKAKNGLVPKDTSPSL